MSSPFAWFRKKQKLLLGVFGVGLIFVFTISLGSGIDPIVDALSGGGPGVGSRNSLENVVVAWDGGQLNQVQMDNLRIRRRLVLQFLYTAEGIARQRGALGHPIGIEQTDSEESLLRATLLAQHARELGIVVSDEAIIDYLNQVTDNTITLGELASILKQTTNGRMSQDQLFAAIREELLAQKTIWIAQQGMVPMSPVSSWDYYRRLNRQINAELMELKVADFVDQTHEPSEAEVTELYEKYKNQYSFPSSPDPGFRRRDALAFSYVRVDYDAIEAAEAAKVTDEEIEKYYNENKDEFRVTDDPVSATDSAPSENTDSSELESNTSDSSLDTSAPPDSSDLGIPADSEKPTESTTDGQPEPQTPSNEPGPTSGTEPDGDGSLDGPASSDQGSVRNSSPTGILLAQAEALQEDGPADTAPAASSDDSAAQDPTEVASDEPTKPNADVATDPSDTEETTENEIDDSESNESAPEETSSGISVDDLGEGTTALDPELVRYSPLEEVKEKIRVEIAKPRAQESFEQAVKSALSTINGYSHEYSIWRIKQVSEPNLKQPKQPDFLELMDNYPGVTLGNTPLVDPIEIGDYDIGKATDIQITNNRSQPFIPISFASVAYGDSTPLFKGNAFPTISDQQKFVFWKTDIREGYVPELNDIRDEVIHAIKLRKAYDLAKAEAEKLMTQADRSGKSLKETFPEKADQIFETGETTWMAQGNMGLMGGGPVVNSIENVESAGNEFMESVFHLKAGEFGVAANQPQSSVYVARVISATPTDEELQQQYLLTGATLPVRSIAMAEGGRLIGEWYQELERESNVVWNREPLPATRAG